MLILIQGKEYKIPVALMDITLSERILFDNTYGKELSERLVSLLVMPEGFDREMAIAEYHVDLAMKTVSFFGKVPMEVLEQTAVEDILVIYHQSMEALSAEANFSNKDFELQQEFEWEGELWEIAPPVLDHVSKMTAGEFLDAKQAMKNLYELSNERWEALLMLCCVYFRKKGERYRDAFAQESSERYKQMQSLPLEYALHVGFFLSASMSSYIQAFLSSSQPEELAVQN